METTQGYSIPVRTVKAKSVLARLRRRIRKYENRYEMPSERMAQMLQSGDVRETAEIVKWMQAYHVLRYLKEKTPTNGTRGTTTEPSTNSD